MPLLPQSAFQFCGPTNPVISPRIDAQDSINLFPETEMPNSKGQIALIGAPGYSTAYAVLTAGGPVRGIWSNNGRMFAVGANHFYEVAPFTGAITTDYGAMGAAPLIPYYCQIVQNGNGQVVCMDSSNSSLYYADPGGPVMTKVLNATAVEYADGFFVAISTGASLATVSPNQINVSAPLDAATWPALAYAVRTSASDLITNLAYINKVLWVFGQKTTSLWQNVGAPNFPFQEIPGGQINVGLWAPGTLCKVRDKAYFLGTDQNGYGRVYRTSGVGVEPISTPAIEYLINTATIGTTIRAFSYEESGHTFYCIQGLGDTCLTLCYDESTNMWHRRAFNNSGTPVDMRVGFACAVNSTQGVGTGTAALMFVGDVNNGNIYKFGCSYASDAGTAKVYQRAAPYLSNENRWTKFPFLEIDSAAMSAGIVIDHSDDGGSTWNGSRTLTAQPAPTTGGLQRYFGWQWGRSRARIFRATITSSADLVRLAGAYVRAVQGTES